MAHSAPRSLPRRQALGAAFAASAASALPAWVGAQGRAGASTGAGTGPGRLTPALAESLPRALAGCGLPPASLGLYVGRVEGDDALAVLNPEQSFVMASTAKIVTTLAALELLGPRWRWRTHAFATGPVDAGCLRGDLMIVGGGDPRLSSGELRQWLQGLRSQGLAEIRGDLVVDRSAFSLQEQDHAGTPLPGPDRPHHARPDALSIDAGIVHVQVLPARGRLVEVRSEPPLGEPMLVNRLNGGGACAAGLRWQDEQGQARLSVEGQWGAGCGRRELAIALPAGASMATQAVAGLWRDVGGRLLGRVREGNLAAAGQEQQRLPLLGTDGEPLLPLSTHASPPLPEVLREINKTSNNLAARHLMLSLARGFPSRAATLAAARERINGWLLRQGLLASDVELDNGSGLSRAERSRPRALVQLLRRAWRNGEAGAFIDSLPVAGVDGTLAHRLQGGAAMGQAYLKTGTLLDTRALAGYVRSRSGAVHAVAVFVNHPEASRATPALDAVIEGLARHG